ncbi:MAG: chorismate mutase [Victivallales bacterium]|nr:chorismate mutase [Victivallales bacterium]
MKNLQEIRSDINDIDSQLVPLLVRRLEIFDEVAAIKQETNTPIYDPARERALLNMVSDQAGPRDEVDIRTVFSTLLHLSKARQRAFLKPQSPLTDAIQTAIGSTGKFPTRSLVACPGAEGAYSQQAVSKMFAVPTILFFNRFDKVFEAVERGLCPYGVLPIENTAAGSVVPVYDAMRKHKFYIVKSCRLRIDHVLLGKRGSRLEDIRCLASQPHALAQCSEFIKKLQNCTITPSDNTAIAAQELASGDAMDKAIIASRECALLYDLDILADNINDTPMNYTRFICISRKMEIYEDAQKLSIMLALPHTPGALSSLLARFAAIGLNLTKLESRPIPGMDFQFLFTFDFEASPKDPHALQLLAELSMDPQISHFTFLGAYGEH